MLVCFSIGIKEKMLNIRFIYHKFTRGLIRVYFKKFVFLINFVAFISLSVFATHNHHDNDSLLVKKDSSSCCFEAQKKSIEDEDDSFCAACYWQSIAYSNDFLDKLIFTYENPIHILIKLSLNYYSIKIDLPFQKRAPPFQISVYC